MFRHDLRFRIFWECQLWLTCFPVNSTFPHRIDITWSSQLALSMCLYPCFKACIKMNDIGFVFLLLISVPALLKNSSIQSQVPQEVLVPYLKYGYYWSCGSLAFLQSAPQLWILFGKRGSTQWIVKFWSSCRREFGVEPGYLGNTKECLNYQKE